MAEPRASGVGSLSDELAHELADVLRALGHPLRLRIMALLVQGARHVGAIADELGSSQAVTSQQLRILRLSRLVEVTRERGQALYRLATPHFGDLLGCLVSCRLGAEGRP